MESWAEGIEVLFALQRYKTQFGDSTYKHFSNLQIQTITGEPIYTSIVYDLIDDDDQSEFGSSYPKDRVKGYTIKQVETGLRGARRWTDWRNNMISRHANSTERYI